MGEPAGSRSHHVRVEARSDGAITNRCVDWADDHLEDLQDHDDHGTRGNQLEHKAPGPLVSAASAGQKAA